MKKNIKLICILLLLSVFATDRLCAQAQLFVRLKSYDDAVMLNFFPLNPSVWTQNLDTGFRIERVELNMEGTAEVPGTRVQVAANLRPQTPAWFETHKAEEDGLMQAVGALLYDTVFQFKNKSLIDPDSMRWNYVMYETLNRPQVGLAVGLMLPDTTAQIGKIYRYSVANLRLSDLKADVVINHTGGPETQFPEDLKLKFHFPESRSLSDMIPRLETPVFPQVFALAKSYKDSIMVRWAPSSAKFWYNSNKKGYWLLRFEETKGLLSAADTLGLIRPWTKEKTLKWVETDGSDSLGMLAAGILYNEDKTLAAGPVSEQAQMFQTKYGFALFAAEGSRLAAQVLGLGYSDKNVKPGKTYVYQIVAVDAPSAFSRGETRIVNEPKAMPKVASFQAFPGDHLIELKWEIAANRPFFSAYQLERADESGVWIKLHQNPLTFIDNEDAPISVYAFRDSVAENYKKFRYRLRGLDSFGDWSPWDELQTEAVDLTPPPAPFLTLTHYNDTTNTALIRWEISSLPDDFSAFSLEVGENPDEKYTALAQLKKDVLSFVWKPDTLLNGNRSYFFRVVASDVHGNKNASIERFMTVPDLIAPPPPARVAGYIAEDGTVSLVWEPSTAKDLNGYWVYYANNPTDEFSVRNTKRITDNVYAWKIEDKSLTEYLYVAVAGEDTHFNRGKPSTVLQLKRLDKVPPVTPQLKSVVQDGKSVRVKWEPSVSKDAKQQVILRRYAGDNASDWAVLDTLVAFVSSYSDTLIRLNDRLLYAVRAKDDAGNWSDTSNTMGLKVRFAPELAAISQFKLSRPKDQPGIVQLNWEYTPLPSALLPKGRFEFLVYRSTGNENPDILTTLASTERSYTDRDIAAGVVYNYFVQILYPGTRELGQKSPVKSVLINADAPLAAAESAATNGQIVVRAKDLTIANGDESPTEADNTDFGLVGAGTQRSNGFNIQNNGEKDIRLPNEAISIESDEPAVWKLIQLENRVVKGFGNSGRFFIEFTPKTEKEYRAQVRIASNPAYTFTIRGRGSNKAELDVQGKGVSITNNDMRPSPSDDTDFDNIRTGTAVVHTFLIKNVGSAPLRCPNPPQVSGASAFTVKDFQMPKNGAIPVGGSVELNLEFKPLETSAHEAEVVVYTDDEDEAMFKFGISGIGLGPEISLFGENGGEVKDGANTAEPYNGTDFGKVGINSGHRKTFTIRNTGGVAINLTGRPKIKITRDEKSSFSVVQEPPEYVKPGNGEAIFQVIFQPKTAGLKKAMVSIENNDASESDFKFVIEGIGAGAPVLELYGKDTSPIVADADSASLAQGTDFGIEKKGSTAFLTLRLVNKGEADLHLEKMEIEGPNATDFAIETPPDLLIPAGSKSAAAVIAFKPQISGLKTAVVTIKSDDPVHGVFRFKLKGRGE